MYLQSEARCPYCHQLLPKIPQRKAKCPHCGQFYYVRTRPADREKVIVTEQEADVIEAEWEIQRVLGDPVEWEERLRSLSKDADPWERPYYEAMLARSRREYDKAWRLYNEARLQAGRESQLGIYRNITLDMAHQMRVEGKHHQALVMLCEVCFYDANGASNAGICIEGRRRVPFGRAWDPETAFLAPAVVAEVRDCVRKLGLGKEEFQQLVLEHLKNIWAAMKPPFPPKAVLPTLLQISFTEKDIDQIELPARKAKIR